MKDYKRCPACGWEKEATPNELLEHVLGCEEAEPPVKDVARQLLAQRAAARATPVVCCLIRKKVRLIPEAFSEEACGVSDAELADVLTFDRSPNARPVIAFRFCPWCGAKWVPSGAIHEAPLGPNEPTPPCGTGL